MSANTPSSSASEFGRLTREKHDNENNREHPRVSRKAEYNPAAQFGRLTRHRRGL